MLIKDFSFRLDLLNLVAKTAQKARARFFEQSLWTVTGKLVRGQNYAIRDGNGLNSYVLGLPARLWHG